MLLQDMMTSLSFDNPHIIQVLLTAAVAFGFGYLVYIYCIILLVKEKRSPYPVWMHTFYLACDIIGTVFWFIEAKQNDWFWAFCAFSVAMFIWVCCELWSLYMAIKHERQEAFGRYYAAPVTEKQALNRIVVQTIMFGSLICSFLYFMGGFQEAAIFKLYVWTNLLVALGPTYLWSERQARSGAGVNISIMILISIICTYLPPGFGMWTTISQYFNTPTFYIAGVIATGYAIFNLRMQMKYAPKPTLMNGKKTLK